MNTKSTKLSLVRWRWKEARVGVDRSEERSYDYSRGQTTRGGYDKEVPRESSPPSLAAGINQVSLQDRDRRAEGEPTHRLANSRINSLRTRSHRTGSKKLRWAGVNAPPRLDGKRFDAHVRAALVRGSLLDRLGARLLCQPQPQLLVVSPVVLVPARRPTAAVSISDAAPTNRRWTYNSCAAISCMTSLGWL